MLTLLSIELALLAREAAIEENGEVAVAVKAVYSLDREEWRDDASALRDEKREDPAPLADVKAAPIESKISAVAREVRERMRRCLSCIFASVCTDYLWKILVVVRLRVEDGNGAQAQLI